MCGDLRRQTLRISGVDVIRACKQRVNLRIVRQQRHRVNEVLESSVLDEDTGTYDQEHVLCDAQPGASSRPVRWIEEVSRRSDGHHEASLR